jgi:hypothetical protein
LASVQELKDVLSIEQNRTVELAEKSFQAIDTITNQANFWLTALSIVIAIIGLIGLAAVYFGSKREAKRIAELRINTYIASDEGKALIRSAIEEEIQMQLQQRTFAILTPPDQNDGDKKFPRVSSDKKKEKGSLV